jgi:DNA polymerase III delta prime subunit
MEQIFNEKYRPQSFNEVIGLDEQIPKLVGQDMPHLLFVGPAGSGKTTTAKIIINTLSADTLVLNASKDRGIDVIREKVEPFAAKASDKIKIVFFDEFDATTPQFQTALRNFMETYSTTTRFIATCNYKSKIIEPLISRFAVFQFSNYTDESKFNHLKKIVESEKINIDDDTIRRVVKIYKDDIRGMINFLNKNKSKEIVASDISSDNVILKILSQLKNDKWFDIRNELLNQSLDYNSLIEEMESLIFNHKDIPINVKMKTNSLAQKYQFEMNFSFNKELCFAAFMCEMQSVLKW